MKMKKLGLAGLLLASTILTGCGGNDVAVVQEKTAEELRIEQIAELREVADEANEALETAQAAADIIAKPLTDALADVNKVADALTLIDLEGATINQLAGVLAAALAAAQAATDELTVANAAANLTDDVATALATALTTATENEAAIAAAVDANSQTTAEIKEEIEDALASTGELADVLMDARTENLANNEALSKAQADADAASEPLHEIVKVGDLLFSGKGLESVFTMVTNETLKTSVLKNILPLTASSQPDEFEINTSGVDSGNFSPKFDAVGNNTVFQTSVRNTSDNEILMTLDPDGNLVTNLKTAEELLNQIQSIPVRGEVLTTRTVEKLFEEGDSLEAGVSIGDLRNTFHLTNTNLAYGEDDHYLSFGWWFLSSEKDEPLNSKDTYSGLAVYAAGDDPFDVDNMAGLTGSVTYRGQASALYVPLSNVDNQVVVGNNISTIMGDLSLTAKFADNTISGAITNINTINGNATPLDVDGQIDLAKASFNGNSWKGLTTGDYNGEWGGQFHGNGATDGRRPEYAIGTFNGVSTTGTFLGNFYGKKQ